MTERALTYAQISLILAAVNEQRPLIPARHLVPVRLICFDAVQISQSLGQSPGHSLDQAEVGMRARAAAQLLLDLICPSVRPDVRDELALACERAALVSQVA